MHVRGCTLCAYLSYKFSLQGDAFDLPCNHARCTRCAFPAAACIASVIFCLTVLILTLQATSRMMKGAINRALQHRIRDFHRTFAAGTQCVLAVSLSFARGRGASKCMAAHTEATPVANDLESACDHRRLVCGEKYWYATIAYHVVGLQLESSYRDIH